MEASTSPTVFLLTQSLICPHNTLESYLKLFFPDYLSCTINPKPWTPELFYLLEQVIGPFKQKIKVLDIDSCFQ